MKYPKQFQSLLWPKNKDIYFGYMCFSLAFFEVLFTKCERGLVAP